MHLAPLTLTCPAPDPGPLPLQEPLDSAQFMAQARDWRAHLPAEITHAVAQFRRHSHPSGALLMRGLPVGAVPRTPSSPTEPTSKDLISERTLLAVASLLGEPVGYEPELGGRLVQNLVPTRANQHAQTSTSSLVPLMFHTETAFHPYRPAYLALLCLRGDERAMTTLCSINQVWPHLSRATQRILFEPRFRTAIDQSFLNGRANQLGPPMAVLTTPHDPVMVFDEDLMVGTDPAADQALHELGRAVAQCHSEINLTSGDLLIIDNARAVHGRSAYQPRFDGNDRWLQRTFVIEQLPLHAQDLHGRVITTQFGQ